MRPSSRALLPCACLLASVQSAAAGRSYSTSPYTAAGTLQLPDEVASGRGRTAPRSAAAARPVIEVLGTYDITLVETTPIVYEGELWLFEAVHHNYWNNSIDKPFALRPHQRFVNMLTGEKTPVFGVGHLFGCAYVDDATATVYAFGTYGDPGAFPGAGQNICVTVSLCHCVLHFCRSEHHCVTASLPHCCVTVCRTFVGQNITVFVSTDRMQTWKSHTALNLGRGKTTW